MSSMKSIQLAVDEALERLLSISPPREAVNKSNPQQPQPHLAPTFHDIAQINPRVLPSKNIPLVSLYVLMEDDEPIGIYAYESDVLADKDLCEEAVQFGDTYDTRPAPVYRVMRVNSFLTRVFGAHGL